MLRIYSLAFADSALQKNLWESSGGRLVKETDPQTA
jgi:hypothetical protein